MWSTEVKSAFAKGCRGSSRASALARNVAYYRAMSVINPTQRPQPCCKSPLRYVAEKKQGSMRDSAVKKCLIVTVRGVRNKLNQIPCLTCQNNSGEKAIAALVLAYAAFNNCDDQDLAAGGGSNTACGAIFLTGVVVFK
jgi:hypothetical protein